jgi:lysophospholipase L1-like esterase
MKNLLFAFAAWCAAASLSRADDARPVVNDSKTTLAAVANPALPTLYIVGDSTAHSDAPLRGWGSEIGAFFDPEKINVVNRAIGGRSTRTFITDGRWDKILAKLKPGDFILVQFGHNDDGDYRDPKAKGRPSIRGDGDEAAEAIKADLKTMETIHTFGWYLRKYATDAKAKGATPILLSKVPHKDWKDGHIVRERDQATFTKWTRETAAARGARFVDANEIISEGFERLGPDKVMPLFGDQRTHSSPEGARYNAAAIVAGLKALRPNPLAPYFSKAADDLPPSLRAP